MKRFLTVIIILFFAAGFSLCSLASNTVNFMNKTYSLKWSNKNSAGGFTNEYIQSSDTFDTYKTMVTISEFTKVKDHITAAKSMYGEFAKNVKSGKAVMATIDKINDKAVLVRFCAVANVPKPNLECDYYNVQASKNGNSVKVFQFTQRYFLNEVKLTQSNVEKFMKTEASKVQPYITKITMPEIVQNELNAESSYIYGVKKK